MGRPQQTKASEEFRNYGDSQKQQSVAAFYKVNHTNQTLEFVQKQKEKYCKGAGREMSCWDAVLLLNELVDDSDPDTDHTQIIHLLQTAESIRAAYPGPEYEWFHLVGFLHDLGKVLAHPSLYNEPQWAVVGDTFPLGCEFDSNIIFHDYFKLNPDINVPAYNTQCGIYNPGIGIDNLTLSWGHDEYMYQICKLNGCTLPERALKVIRYHSFYSWHNKGSYTHFMTEDDKETLHWVKEFQKHDLYSKLPEKPNVEALTPYYQGLINKYFPAVMKW